MLSKLKYWIPLKCVSMLCVYVDVFVVNSRTEHWQRKRLRPQPPLIVSPTMQSMSLEHARKYKNLNILTQNLRTLNIILIYAYMQENLNYALSLTDTHILTHMHRHSRLHALTLMLIITLKCLIFYPQNINFVHYCKYNTLHSFAHRSLALRPGNSNSLV